VRTLINIDVPELEAAIKFYEAAVGLELTRVLDDDVAELVGASSVVYLLQKDAGSLPSSGAELTRSYSRHWTPVHVDFVVEDVERATARAVQAGAVRESKCVEWRGSKCITLSDPFGNGFCFIEFAEGTYRTGAA
jgi:predicted enzyme related to lactoylglutathione lyase